MTRRETEFPFLLAVWLAADASRRYRDHADTWRAAGAVDYAAQLDAAADAHDAAWDARMRAHHDHRAR